MLLYPKWTEDYGIFAHFAKKASCFLPLNLAYVASVAENQGHEVRIIDGQVENKSLEKIINDTMEFNPDIIGVTATTPFFHFAEDSKEMLSHLAEFGIVFLMFTIGLEFSVKHLSHFPPLCSTL